jgi:predicted CoA-binding protein
MKKYVVLGASANPTRHSNKVVKSLIRRGLNLIPVGPKKKVKFRIYL